MIAGRFSLLAVALALVAASPAHACCYGCGWGAAYGQEMLFVNQGPVASGPGPYIMGAPNCRPARDYPYVGFIYSGEPYGFYLPTVGAPPVFYWPRLQYRYYGVVRMYW
jgi:hypothetical protein